MLPRRIYLNLAAFALLFVALAAWAAVNIIQPGILQDTYRVDARFEEATGLRPGVEVTFRGVRVGDVAAVDLEPGAAVVALDIDARRELPGGATAAVRRRSAVGEPYVAIDPPAEWSPGGPTIATSGHVIPIESTSTPLAYGDLFAAADELLTSIDRGDLHTVVSELATALEGRGDELRRIITSSADVVSTFAGAGAELDRLSVELTALTGTLADTSATIADSTDDLTTVVASLSSRAADIQTLLARTPPLAEQVDAILEASYFQLQCGLRASGTIASAIGSDETIAQITRLLRAAETASVVIPQAVYDGPDGRYLSGTFGFAPGEPVEYAHFTEFDAPREVAACPAGVQPAPGGLLDSAIDATGTAAATSDGAAGSSETDQARPDGAAAPAAGTGEEGGDLSWLPFVGVFLAAGAAAGAVIVARRLKAGRHD